MPRFPLKIFLKDRFIRFPLFISLFLNLLIWLYLGFSVKPTPETVFLHYTVHFGVDLAGFWSSLFLLPLLGLVLLLINFFLAYFIYDKDRRLSLLLSVCAPPLQASLLLEGIFLVFLNR